MTRCEKGLQARLAVCRRRLLQLPGPSGKNQAGACGSLSSLVPAVIMRKIHLILIVLLSMLSIACQLDPTKARVERVLTASWQSYCRHFISSDGQVVIPEEGGGTISEAQAYALLRAVWANDAPVFNRVYAFTYEKLSRAQTHGDSLLAWRWGRLPDGSWGVLDANSATDGDLDYALALVLAHRKGWRAPPHLPDYREEARRVQTDILAKEVVTLPGGDVLLTPGNWHELTPPYLVNPSYFSPAAYSLFASPPGATDSQGGAGPVEAVREPPLQVEVGATTDRARWSRLHQSTYKLLGQIARGLGDQTGVGLFPDWCRVDAAGHPAPAPGKDTRFGWEAVRLPFRVALDGLWFQEPRAAQLLTKKFLPWFKSQWQARARLVAVYNFDGSPAVDYESPVLYAGVLAGALAAGDRDFAHQMALKILSFYHEDSGRAYFEAPDHYYANNWAWLGLALYAGWVK
jgi:endoglucanase